jgi:hypothetical protein
MNAQEKGRGRKERLAGKEDSQAGAQPEGSDYSPRPMMEPAKE